MTGTGGDKRAHGRANKVAFVALKSADATEKDVIARVETLDISQGGVRLSSDNELPKGSRWNVTLLLSESVTLNADWELRGYVPANRAVSAVASVTRCKGAPEIGYEVALRFESLSQTEAEEIRHFMSEA